MNLSYFIRLTLAICLYAGLFGCFAKKKPSVQIPDPAEVQLAETTASIDRSMVEWAESHRSQAPINPKKLPLFGVDIPQIVSVDWSGPIEPLLKRILSGTSYRLRILGKPPASPVLVSLQIQHMTVSYTLRYIAYQMGSQADIHVDTSHKIVELRYASH